MRNGDLNGSDITYQKDRMTKNNTTCLSFPEEYMKSLYLFAFSFT